MHVFNNTCLVHERAIRRNAKYLTSTSTYVDLPDGNLQVTTRRIVYKPDIEKFIECYVDVNFAVGWDQADADHAENFIARMVYVIMYAVYLLLWYSKLQTQFALSTTEAEYIALSQAIRKVINFMALMKEVSFIFDIQIPKPEVFCRSFEENKS